MLSVHIAFFHEALGPSKIKYSVNQGLAPILPHHESPTTKNLCYIFYSVCTLGPILQLSDPLYGRCPGAL